MELDVYIPSIKYAIEYDGEAWHTNERLKIEKHKWQLCREQGIHLIRVREKMPPSFSPIADCLICDKDIRNYKYKYVKEKLSGSIIEVLRILSKFNVELQKKCLLGYIYIDVDIKRDSNDIMNYKMELKGDTLQSKFPEIAKEWHPIKNSLLTPDMFRAGSGYKVWWKCSKCGFDFEQTINHRTSKTHSTGCPKCGIKKVAIIRGIAVNMLDIDTHKIVKTFVSMSEASRITGINNSNIAMVCKGIRSQAGGYCWEYVKRENEK